MIPRLYEASERQFTSNGLGPLPDAISCSVTEELNGSFFLRMNYPADGKHFRDIQLFRIILAKPARSRSYQPFQITEITKKIDGTIDIYAPHISHQLKYFLTKPFSISAVSGLIYAASVTANFSSMVIDTADHRMGFVFSADSSLSSGASYELKTPRSIHSQLSKGDGSALNQFGGEIEWDGWQVRWVSRRGKNEFIKIRYGRDLTGLNALSSAEAMSTAVVPFWYKAGTDSEPEIYRRLPEYVLPYPGHEDDPYLATIPLDLSSVLPEEGYTEAMMRSYAEHWMIANLQRTPTFSADINFVPLWETEEYKGIMATTPLSLGDTVTVEHYGLAYSTTSRIIKTVYDVLTERYEEIEIGDPRDTLTRKISRG